MTDLREKVARADVRPGLRVAIRCLEKAAQRHDDAGDGSYATVIDKATSELHERLAAADAALAAMPGGGVGWNDIATVPQTGDVLLWLREPFARVEIAHWNWRLDCFVSPDEMTEFGKLMPSHWMALPAAPTPPAAAEETDHA